MATLDDIIDELTKQTETDSNPWKEKNGRLIGKANTCWYRVIRTGGLPGSRVSYWLHDSPKSAGGWQELGKSSGISKLHTAIKEYLQRNALSNLRATNDP